MSTGISISSINRIKELADEKRFAEALEILDTQNLDKSINPQFLRISGEIFRENKRYYDSRKYLIKAHQMSPQGTRIISELIQLYLELGYYTRAQKYYEEYMFYVSPEDVQKDYVEYIMKKAQGADIKEIASVLIPILETMPEDRWNFEAVLLYDKMNRKDKALEECQYILEHYKDSIYVEPVIQYIDDQLDVDTYFMQYPKEEQTEDTELFGDLIGQEDAILEADHLRMYPPEARIMVEADDKDGIDAKPVKEKKKKKKSNRKKAAKEETTTVQSDNEDATAVVTETEKDTSQQRTDGQATEASVPETKEKETQSEQTPEQSVQEQEKSSEEQRKEEREIALDKILSKKVDKDKIRETAKHVAQSVKDIDTSKTKEQVKNVAGSLKDNVAKATETLSEAVGAKISIDSELLEPMSEEFVDGIIEGVLEAPKKTVGEVVVNEELDALIPDSLEAISEQEAAELEAKKEAEERMELEALETSMRLEEEKKEARLRKKKQKAVAAEQQETTISEQQTQEPSVEQEMEEEEVVVQSGVVAEKIATVSFEELKARFLEEMQEEKPLDSLGFMSVVQSDVDSAMKENIPQEAEILHQMIDNKEFYSGEDSKEFESLESYEGDDFEVEDYSFVSFGSSDKTEKEMSLVEENYDVEDIFAEEPIVDFDTIIPPVEMDTWEDVSEEIHTEPIPLQQEPEVETQPEIRENSETNPADVTMTEPVVEMEQSDVIAPEPETEQAVVMATEEEPEESNAEPENQVIETAVSDEIPGEDISDGQIVQELVNDRPDREQIRIRIVLTKEMIQGLSVLKESRC
ncbi:uncharacterized protein BN724_00765 [Clostridium sp. CAG:590]|nr:uncharacterized protein BN724_00765 [Clostridium sp. CAG:590]